MYRLFLLFLLCSSCYAFPTFAQLLPKEGAMLNYRLIGFSVPQGRQVKTYKLEIADGYFNNTDSFSRNIVKTCNVSDGKIVTEVPLFGRTYTWRAISRNEGTLGGLNHFSTKKSKEADTSLSRLRILVPAQKYNDAYVLMDGTKALYDMKGNMVWYLDEVNGISANLFSLAGDISLTKQGTLTFMINRQGGHIYEINYNGDVLWKGPNTGEVSGDTSEAYNHEFTRLTNGHYMVMGGEHVKWQLPGKVDTSYMNQPGNQGKIIVDNATHTYYEHMDFGTLIEYDEQGKVVWSWRSSKYYKDADVFRSVMKNGTYLVKDVHANAFYFDEQKQAIYMSFKNTSRIVKIKYPEGNILAVYGKKYDARHGVKGYGTDLFAFQHNCRITQDGDLSIFNNNCRRPEDLPKLMLLKEPETPDGKLKTVWEYDCTIEGFDSTDKEPPAFTALGSLEELPDRSLFASMSSYRYSKAFLVSRDKKVLWSAMPEHWNEDKKKWMPVIQYRASIVVDRSDLERLIWNTEKK